MADAILRSLPFLLHGLLLTAALSIGAIIAGTLLGFAIAVVHVARVPVLARLGGLYVLLIQGTPLLVVLLVCYFVLPGLLHYRATGFGAGLLGFSLFTAAYVAEDARAGLESVPMALREAGRALGLSRAKVMRFIVLPLALRTTVPPLIGQYVRVIKFTSVASVIGVNELMGSTLLVNARVFQPALLLALSAAAYFVLCFSLSLLGRRLHARLALAQR